MTKRIPPTLLTVLTKKKKLQQNFYLHIHNQEMSPDISLLNTMIIIKPDRREKYFKYIIPAQNFHFCFLIDIL